MSFTDVRKCGAKRRDGGSCCQPAMANGRCKMHGGKTPSGLASPHTRSGRYSKHLPTRLLARYESAAADPNLMSVRDDVALLQAVISEKLDQMQSAQFSPLDPGILDRVERLRQSGHGWDWTRVQHELDALREAVAEGQREQLAMREVRGLLKEKAALAVQESKRLAELQQFMTVEQVILLAQALVGIVRRHVSDLPEGTDRLRNIAGEFRTVMSRPDQSGRA